jgi:UDP-2,3-diacylglucosamine hydrolase
MAQQKIYFLSDAHLGAKSHADSFETERKLCRWLDMAKSDAKAIYLLGDMFDYWFEYKYVVPKGFTRVLGKLAEVSDSGGKSIFLSKSRYLARRLSYPGVRMILHFEPFITKLGTRKFYLAHGDGLGDDSLSFRFLRALFHNKFLIKCFAAVHPTLTVPLAYKWSNSSRENGGVQEYLGEDKEHLVCLQSKKIVEMPDIDYFVFGHRHILLDLPIGPHTRVIILGDWIRYFSYAVFDGEKVELLQFEE